MKIKYAFIAIVCVGLLSSCYEDKGNYDYLQMNDITVSFSLENNEYVMGDILDIKPELTFASGTEAKKLTYLWTFNGEEISRERNLKWTIDREGKNRDLRLAVKDENSTITYFGWTTITVSSPYVKSGWVILSAKEDGTSMLTYMRPTTKEVENEKGEKEKVYDCVVTKDIYALSNNGAALGGQPVSITHHFVSSYPEDLPEDITSWLWLVQKGGEGCIDVSGSTYHAEGALPVMFINGGYPQSFEPQRVYDMLYLTMAIGTDGNIYTRVKESYKLFNSSYFLDDAPLSFQQKPVDGTMIAMTPSFCEHAGTLLYDKNSSRYLHICDLKKYVYVLGGGSYYKSYSGNVVLPTVDESTYEKHSEWARIDDMSGYKVHYLGACSNGWAGGLRYMAIIEKDNQFYIQDFIVDDYSGGDTMDAYINSQEKINEFATIISDGVKNKYSLCFYQDNGRPYLLLSRDNELYIYYFKGDAGKRLIKYHTFNSTITSIDTDGTGYNGHAGVGLENGEFYVLSLNSGVIKDIIQTGDSDDKILFKQEGLGKVVESIFKFNAARDWVAQ